MYNWQELKHNFLPKNMNSFTSKSFYPPQPLMSLNVHYLFKVFKIVSNIDCKIHFPDFSKMKILGMGIVVLQLLYHAPC